jgi:hypothetical protein
VGALEAVEGTAGGNLYRVTGWRTPNPSVVITGPNGQIIREGTLSSFRSVPSAASRATRTTGGAPGEFIYGAEGGAARVAQPVPVAEPAVVPVVEPAPVVAPSAPPVWVPPDVSGNLATMGATSGVGAAADFEARRRGGAQPAPTTTTDPTPAAATQPAGQQAEEPREEEICPRGTVEIMWPPAVWRASGRQDTGAINGVFDRPPTRIVTKIPSPARNRTIIGQYVGNNWAALQAYYPRTGALGAIHHKWPLYLGGPDAISNLVFLTFAEHTVWHSALTTQTTGPVGTRYCIVN